jgi:hypothetical protein
MGALGEDQYIQAVVYQPHGDKPHLSVIKSILGWIELDVHEFMCTHQIENAMAFEARRAGRLQTPFLTVARRLSAADTFKPGLRKLGRCDISRLGFNTSRMPMAQPTDYQVTDYNRGEMKVDEHVSMYRLFNTLVHWGSLVLATILSFFILLLCARIGFLPSATVSVMIAVIGTLWLRRPKPH